jgi:hypothetical protein
MPRADNLPTYAFRWIEIPCKTNPLGIKGSGEAGAISAAPALMNALIDALSPLGVTHLDMPATRRQSGRRSRLPAASARQRNSGVPSSASASDGVVLRSV